MGAATHIFCRHCQAIRRVIVDWLGETASSDPNFIGANLRCTTCKTVAAVVYRLRGAT